MLRVLKLGGSLYGSPDLPHWLAALASARGLVVVPGGGPFADQVRTAQSHLCFDDAHAHHMALLAMEQFGLALCGLAPGLRPVATRDAMADTLARGQTPVWMPTAMSLFAPGIPEDWTVTSDSLAAWLADVLGAEALALVKHGPDGAADYDASADADRVDTAFPAFARRFGKPISILGQGHPGALAAWLAT